MAEIDLFTKFLDGLATAGITFARGDSLSFSLTTSASAAAARHRMTAHIFQE